MGGKGLVKAGYETIAEAYAQTRSGTSEDVRLVDDFASRLPQGGRVLDAGCGGGRPVSALLSPRFPVVGLDLAEAQVRLLRNHVPAASPVVGEMTRLPFRDASFHGALSLYAIIHVPRDEHRALIQEFHRVLRPSGVALLCMGETDLPHDVAEYMGTRMFWSHFDGPTNERLLTEAGFEVVWSRPVADFQQPSALHRFFLVRRK